MRAPAVWDLQTAPTFNIKNKKPHPLSRSRSAVKELNAMLTVFSVFTTNQGKHGWSGPFSVYTKSVLMLVWVANQLLWNYGETKEASR